jgi:hypothetical protein
VLLCGFKQDLQGSSPLGIALICFGLLFAATVTQGRSWNGYPGASWSRYTTFDLLILMGIYLALLGRIPLAFLANGTAAKTEAQSPQYAVSRLRRIGLAVAGCLSGVIIALQIPLGIHNGLDGARVFYSQEVTAQGVLRGIDHTTNGAIILNLDLFEPPSLVRKQAHILRSHHLSIFSTIQH